MKIKGAGERTRQAARAMDGTSPKGQGSKEDKTASPTPITSMSTHGAIRMLATPRNSFSTVQDNDVDDLLAECAAVGFETKATPAASFKKQAPSSEASKPAKSIEYEKYTVDDIDEWLVLTRFYDEAYRQTTLARHRRGSRLAAIEQEKQQLLQEEQEDLQQHQVELDTSSIVAAAPEPTPGPKVTIKKDESNYGSPPAHITPLKASKQKRANSDTIDETSDQREHPAKLARRQSLERFQIESLKHTPSRGPAQSSDKSTPLQNDMDMSRRITRPDLFEDYVAPRRARRAPETRYFHIRSWNHDNVRAAQQDCIWVTQKTNERKFVEAFEQSRRVILFFSVNNSKAFQGIAEMGSIPGAAGLRNPAWRSNLHWPSTEAFALIWLLKEEVPHHTVRHLINPLNDDLPAHVGTDGVEVETFVGEQMYRILQDVARRRNGRH